MFSSKLFFSTGNSKRTRSTRQQKGRLTPVLLPRSNGAHYLGDASGVDNSQKTPPPGVIYYDDPMGRWVGALSTL